jgi:hypothetical protein
MRNVYSDTTARQCGIARTLILGLLVLGVGFAHGQDSSSGLETYFAGKEVIMKLDMPGSQKGVDLRFNKAVPMDWKEYSSRVKQFGVAIHKGDTARITSIVVKKDMIEFQLDGGGFGTFGDDTSTTVEAKTLEKSDYEKDLEKQIAQTDDDDKRRSLQRELDRERARRERQDSINKHQAQIASQVKAQTVAQNRVNGGSRFNLRWSGSIPADQLTPEAVMQRLSEYVEFSGGVSASANTNAGVPAGAAASDDQSSSPTAKLQRGMKMEDVSTLLGQGKQLSESVGDAGLKTQVYEYFTNDRRVEITYVDGLVVRFSISSK